LTPSADPDVVKTACVFDCLIEEADAIEFAVIVVDTVSIRVVPVGMVAAGPILAGPVLICVSSTVIKTELVPQGTKSVCQE
jgi:hypothetical protein